VVWCGVVCCAVLCCCALYVLWGVLCCDKVHSIKPLDPLFSQTTPNNPPQPKTNTPPNLVPAAPRHAPRSRRLHPAPAPRLLHHPIGRPGGGLRIRGSCWADSRSAADAQGGRVQRGCMCGVRGRPGAAGGRGGDGRPGGVRDGGALFFGVGGWGGGRLVAFESVELAAVHPSTQALKLVQTNPNSTKPNHTTRTRTRRRARSWCRHTQRCSTPPTSRARPTAACTSSRRCGAGAVLPSIKCQPSSLDPN